jgi:transposase-like protein
VEHLRELGYTWEEVAEAVGWNASSLRKWMKRRDCDTPQSADAAVEVTTTINTGSGNQSNSPPTKLAKVKMGQDVAISREGVDSPQIPEGDTSQAGGCNEPVVARTPVTMHDTIGRPPKYSFDINRLMELKAANVDWNDIATEIGVPRETLRYWHKKTSMNESSSINDPRSTDTSPDITSALPTSTVIAMDPPENTACSPTANTAKLTSFIVEVDKKASDIEDADLDAVIRKLIKKSGPQAIGYREVQNYLTYKGEENHNNLTYLTLVLVFRAVRAHCYQFSHPAQH